MKMITDEIISFLLDVYEARYPADGLQLRNTLYEDGREAIKAAQYRVHEDAVRDDAPLSAAYWAAEGLQLIIENELPVLNAVGGEARRQLRYCVEKCREAKNSE